eukprot:3542753-Pyramimonas_sp.AAC.1
MAESKEIRHGGWEKEKGEGETREGEGGRRRGEGIRGTDKRTTKDNNGLTVAFEDGPPGGCVFGGEGDLGKEHGQGHLRGCVGGFGIHI